MAQKEIISKVRCQQHRNEPSSRPTATKYVGLQNNNKWQGMLWDERLDDNYIICSSEYPHPNDMQGAVLSKANRLSDSIAKQIFSMPLSAIQI